MKSTQALIGIGLTGLLSSTPLLLAADTAIAASKVTGVQVKPTANGINVVLQTQGSDRPKIFSVNRGNTWTADLVNTQLQVPGGKYQKANPAAGIRSLTVTAIDKTTVRITVVGQTAAPKGQMTRNTNGSIAFSVTPAPVKTAAKPASVATGKLGRVAPQAAPAASLPSLPNTLAQAAPTAPAPRTVAQTPPPATATPPTTIPISPSSTITIQGKPYTPPPPIPPSAPLPLPRAIAPPVGDISVGQVDSSASMIDLGTAEVIPRLVLRDASAREVLALLARSAGLNLAYVPPATPQTPGQAAAAAAATAAVDQKINLDIQNEPIQNVFNYVVRLTGLEANRVGRTIFVSPRLPDTARSIVTRTLRLNQVNSTIASNFLVSKGAELQLPITRETVVPSTVAGVAPTILREPDIKIITAKDGLAPLPLRGLAVSLDARMNSVTLSGTPRQVEAATALLTQLDARKRQIAVNVKIVDVNLLNTDTASTSFSFGVGSSFFSVDQGAALFNFGRVRPPSNQEVANSLTSPPVTPNLFPNPAEGFTQPELGPFVDGPQPNAQFGTTSLTRPSGFPGNPISTGRSPFGTNGNPYQPGVDSFTPGSISPTGTVTPDQLTYRLPSLFQFPTKFLAQLQAQVVSGNAKILTDPTLAIQEGETSRVSITQDVVTKVTSTITDTAGGSRQFLEPVLTPAGLQLEVTVDRVDDNGFITMRIDPSVSAPTQTVSVGGQDITLLARRDVKSGSIRLRDGQTLILAGIIQDSDRTSVTKVPILGDIPILGALFRRINNTNQRQEVIVLVTPRILDDTDQSAFGYSYTPGLETQRVLQRSNQR